MAHPLFTPQAGVFVPTEYARGPWNPDTLHGGPVAALLAHSVEQIASGTGLRIARLTTDLFRAVPHKPLELETEVVREGRRILAVRASLHCEGVEVSRGQALLLRPTDVDASSTDLPRPPVPFPEDTPDAPLMRMPGRSITYSGTVRFRYISEPGGEAPVAAWIHVPMDLLPGVPLSPAVRAAATSDYVAMLANMRGGRGTGVPFINADITLYLHRPPEGEWLCLETTGRGSHEGIATGDGLMHDRSGLVGRCVAASLAQRSRPGGGTGTR